jgi:hypothetical protein
MLAPDSTPHRPSALDFVLQGATVAGNLRVRQLNIAPPGDYPCRQRNIFTATLATPLTASCTWSATNPSNTFSVLVAEQNHVD